MTCCWTATHAACNSSEPKRCSGWSSNTKRTSRITLTDYGIYWCWKSGCGGGRPLASTGLNATTRRTFENARPRSVFRSGEDAFLDVFWYQVTHIRETQYAGHGNCHPGRWPGFTSGTINARPSQTGGALRGTVPDHRLCPQQLPEQWHEEIAGADTVQSSKS